MSQNQWGGPPPGAGGPHAPGYGAVGPGAQPRRSGGGLWWVLIALAGVLLVALVVVVALRVSGVDEPGPGPTPGPVTSTTSVSTPSESTTPPEPGPSPSETPTDDQWAGYPPPNLGALKDLSDPLFPGTVGSFVLEDSHAGFGGSDATYVDEEAGVVVGVSITTDLLTYGIVIDDMEDPVQVGNAWCADYVVDATGQQRIDCVMAGSGQSVDIYQTRMSVEEVGAFANELYDQF